jgi:hypothetical protein
VLHGVFSVLSRACVLQDKILYYGPEFFYLQLQIRDVSVVSIIFSATVNRTYSGCLNFVWWRLLFLVSSIRNLLHVTHLTLKILSLILDFWNICASPLPLQVHRPLVLNKQKSYFHIRIQNFGGNAQT